MTKKAISPVRRSLLAATALSGVAAASAPAFAQTGDQSDTIIVTGSRLNQANLDSPSPVYQVTAEEIDTRGVTRVEDLLNILPQAFAGQTTDVANGATGTSNLNLRGLGSIRTLVLLDGKRLPFGSPQTSSPNLDLIPAQLIERVDVVTGGQSAVYGSDAIAGVANFILRRDFEGVMFDGQVGFYQDGNGNDYANALLDAANIERPGATLDGREVNTSITFGANTADGRGNVTAFFSYSNQNAIRQDARDYSTCAYSPTPPGPASIGGIACTGSSTFRRIVRNVGSGSLFLQEDGTFVPYTGAPEQTFNFAPDNFIQRPLERFAANFMAHYEVTDNVEAYLDFGFTKNTTDAQIAFSGTFNRPFSVNCDNPYLDASVSTGGTLADALGCTPAMITAGANVPLTAGYRNVTGDPRSSYIDLETFRGVVGFRGTLGDNFSWDTFGQYARTDMTRISSGDLNFQHVQDGLYAVDDGSGNVVCRSGNTGCLPFDIFDFNGVSREAALYAQGNGFINGWTEQQVIGGTIQGDLGAYGFQFPWAESGVQALIGVEHRKDNLDRRPDDISQIPGGVGLTGVGGGALKVSGEVRVTELFMETQIPIVTGKPMFDELGINGAYRYSDYTTDGNGVQNSFNTHTFAAGVTWAPTPDIRFRGQFQRAVRAPNVIELFVGQNTGLFNSTAGPNGLFDPCASGAGGTPAPAATAAQCAFTGVTAAQYGTIADNPAGQLNSVSGGNPFLNPEKSDTYTAGVVLTPAMLPGFNLAVDYFDITVNDAITTIPPQTTLTNCVQTGDPAFCGLIVRDRFGSLWIDNSNFEGVQATNTNIAELATRGLDFAAGYSYDFGEWGSVNWNLVSTYLFEQSSIPLPGGATVECAGFYAGGCSNTGVGAAPKYKHRLLTTWQTPWNVDISATWRYYSTVKNISVYGPGGSPTGNVLDDQLDSANYLDLSAQWYVKENVTLRAGIQNVMGRDPELQTPIGTAPGNGNTLPGYYDPAGRYIFFGVNLSM